MLPECYLHKGWIKQKHNMTYKETSLVSNLLFR